MPITAKEARQTLRTHALKHLRDGSPFGGRGALDLIKDAIYALDPTGEPATKNMPTGTGPALARLDEALSRLMEASRYVSQELGHQNGEDLAKPKKGKKR